MQSRADTFREAAEMVSAMAADFISNRKPGDYAMYEQGIGCERASKMLSEAADQIESIDSIKSLICDSKTQQGL